MASEGESEVELYIKNQEKKPNFSLTAIVKDVYTGKKNLLRIVEDLGSYLTSTEVEVRSKAVQLLSEILQRLVNFKLTEQEVELLANFYCDRLKDHYSIVPNALLGLQALASNQDLSGQLVVMSIQTVFTEVHVQSLMQSGRQTVYSLLILFLEKNLKDLQKLGSDFVFGFIQAMDGEKDPRNLVLAFQLAKKIIMNFPISLFAEDLFEVTSCYFPIDFNPSPDDPYGITRDDLVLGLRKCLSATSLFAPFCLPLLLEKISSDVISAKIDSLLTLSCCMEVYTVQQMKEYLDAFWRAIKKEVYQTVSSDLEEAALKALQSIVCNLYSSSQASEVETRKEFTRTVLQECNELLNSLDLRMMKPNGRILQATALAAEPAYQQVLQSSLPLLLDKYNSQPVGITKKITLDVILELLKVAKTFNHTTQDNALAVHKEALVTLLFEALTSESHALCCAGITGLVALVTLKGMISEDQVNILVEQLSKQALNSKDMMVRQESTTALAYLSSKYPAVIRAKLLPAVQSHLKSEECIAMELERESYVKHSSGNHGYAMETLSTVCTEESVVRDIIPVILQHGKNLAEVNDVSDVIKAKGCRTYKCLLSVIEGTIKRVVQPEYYSALVIPELLHLSIKPVLQGWETNLILESEVLEIFSSIFKTIVCQLQSKLAEKCLQSIVELFLDGKLPNSLNEYKSNSFSPLEVTSPWQQTQLVMLLMPCVCAVKTDVCIPQYSVLIQKLQNLACESNHKKTNIAAAKCLAGLINKMKEGEELNLLIEKLMSSIWPFIVNEECKEKQWSSLITWIWVTRAVILRSLPVSQEFVTKIISLFSSDSLGNVAADGVYILIADSEDVMTLQMHANIRMMYKQRFFIQTLPQLLSGFQSSLPGHKHHYLSALSHLLQWIPKQVLMSEVPNLMPLLIQSLSQDQASLLLSTLQTLYSLIFDAPEAIIRQVTSVMPNFLRLIKFEPSMKVRIEAIKCLGAMTTLPHHVVYVYKSKVIKSLSSSLDDHKRLVRAAAVTCRNEWFLLGAS